MPVAVVSVISNAAKSSLRAYFEGVRWPLNKALPKGAEFLNGLHPSDLDEKIREGMAMSARTVEPDDDTFVSDYTGVSSTLGDGYG